MIRPIPTRSAWHQRLIDGVLAWWSARATRRALHELDSRALADIGVDASEIDSIAAETSAHACLTRLRIAVVATHD
ncbi:MAG: DUF1127 domain-containing protein [Burkholderiales bacterium]|nr:DUF1127 domain-containing protein [Burkholderiales bacterium]